jgi:hypothetical protein
MCATACARQGGGAAASPDKGSEKIVLLEDPAAHADGERVYAAWVIYALTKAATYAEHPPPAANDSADDFALELAARKMQADFWSDQKKEGAPAHALLDKQIEISRAGMLPEFVIAVHGRPGWTVPPDALSKLRFEPFFEKFAGSYAQGAPVQFQARSGKVIPDVPGADFPDPAGLPMGAASCSRALDERKAAWSRFGAVERRLGGVAISAVSTVDFARQLMAAQKEEAHRTRGVTWVSPRVGHLAKLDAFCAVERKDWSDAMRTLSRAVAMRPDDAGLRLEMASQLDEGRLHGGAGVASTRLHPHREGRARRGGRGLQNVFEIRSQKSHCPWGARAHRRAAPSAHLAHVGAHRHERSAVWDYDHGMRRWAVAVTRPVSQSRPRCGAFAARRAGRYRPRAALPTKAFRRGSKKRS